MWCHSVKDQQLEEETLRDGVQLPFFMTAQSLLHLKEILKKLLSPAQIHVLLLWVLSWKISGPEFLEFLFSPGDAGWKTLSIVHCFISIFAILWKNKAQAFSGTFCFEAMLHNSYNHCSCCWPAHMAELVPLARHSATWSRMFMSR